MEKIFFENSRKMRLAGILNVCSPGTKIVVMCHGARSNKDRPTYIDYERELTASGISSFRFDFAGRGESPGIFDEQTIDTDMDDLRSAIDFLAKRGYHEFALLGSSRGGTCALRFAPTDGRVSCLVLLCPGSAIEDYADRLQKVKGYGKPVLIIHGDKDESVPLHHSEGLCEALVHCTLKVIRGADHRFTNPEHYAEKIDLGAAFLRKNI